MSTSCLTRCRVCGAELRPPLWKVLCGFEVDTCDDAVACVTRFRVASETSIESGWDHWAAS